MNRPLSAQAVFHGLEMLLDLRWVAGMAGAERIPGLRFVEAGAPFYGRLNWVHPPRLQICGAEERAFR